MFIQCAAKILDSFYTNNGFIAITLAPQKNA